jgi:hypothetical protein
MHLLLATRLLAWADHLTARGTGPVQVERDEWCDSAPGDSCCAPLGVLAAPVSVELIEGLARLARQNLKRPEGFVM